MFTRRRGEGTASIKPCAPIVRLTACVRQRHYTDVVVVISIDDEQREAPQRNSSGGSPHAGSGHDFPYQGVFRDELERPLNLIPKPHSQVDRARGVVPDVSEDLLVGERVRPNRFTHRPNISRSMRCRSTFQSEVTTSPLSTAAQRRSNSRAQASSTPTS